VNAYAVNVYDTVTCKKVVLRVNRRTILVRRLTGTVNYLLNEKGKWVPLKGRNQKVYQMLYDTQAAAGAK
jgi:hypothetical protein